MNYSHSDDERNDDDSFNRQGNFNNVQKNLDFNVSDNQDIGHIPERHSINSLNNDEIFERAQRQQTKSPSNLSMNSSLYHQNAHHFNGDLSMTSGQISQQIRRQQQKPQRINLDFLNIDEDANEDENEEDDDRFDINMDTGDNKPMRYKRIYDAKYKIPATSKADNSATIVKMIGTSELQQKRLATYKKFTNNVTTVLMGLSGVCMVLLYIYQFISLVETPFYVTRARVKIYEEIDNEQILVSKLMYFLYRNKTSGATDADEGNNQVIVSNLDELCGGSSQYALFSDLTTAKSIQHNVQSVYIYASVIFVLLLMIIVQCFNVGYISYSMKEHQIPLIFRNPNSNLFYDIQRAKNFFYMIFIVLTGILACLNFYVVKDSCLHTADELSFDSETVDMYQYSLTALLWVVAIPMILLFIFLGCRDNLKFGCYPIVIANIIFAFMLLILSQIIVVYSIIYAENVLLKICHIAIYLILGLALANNTFYRVKYGRLDINNSK